MTRSRSILVVEDDPQMGAALCSFLQRKGWQASCAAEKADLRRQSRVVRQRQAGDTRFGELGQSAVMRNVARKLELLAAGTAPVLRSI